MGKKRNFICILVFSLLSLMACSSQRLTDSNAVTADSESKQGNADGKVEMVYVEEEVSLPDSFGFANVVKLQEKDGMLWVFRSRSEAGGAAWILKEEGWQEASEEWMSVTIEDDEGGQPFYLLDYAELPEENKILLFSRTKKNTTGREYRVQKLTDSWERKDVALELPTDIQNARIQGLSDGSFVIWDKSGSHFYLFKDEQQIYQKELTGLGIAGIYELPDGSLVFRPNRNEGLQTVNRTGEQTGDWVPAELYKGAEIRESAMARKPDGGWLFANHSGIYEKKDDVAEWTQLVSASRSSLYFDGFYITAVQPMGDGFYIASETGLYHYQKMPREQKEQITLKVVSPGATDDFLKLAMVQFMQKHPEVDVVLEELEPGEAAMGDKIEEAVQKLNVRMIAGEQPDVVVLNGLPWETYGAKGILEDLNEEFAQTRENGEILDSIMAAMEQEGKLYAIPLSFAPILRECNQSEAMKFTDIDSFLTYLQENAENTGFLLQGGYNKESTLDEALYIMYGHCLYGEDGKLNKGQLISYLKCWQLLRTRATNLHVAQQSFGEFSIEEAKYRMENQLNGFAIVEDDIRSQFGVNALRDTYVENSGLFYPGIILGVGKNSTHKELAIEFVVSCLEQEIQEKQNYMFPVHCQAAYEVMREQCQLWESMIEKKKQRGESIEEMMPPRKEAIEQEWELVKNVTVRTENIRGRIHAKPVRYQIILERAQGWLNGEESLEEVTDNIMAAVKMYEDEQK